MAWIDTRYWNTRKEEKVEVCRRSRWNQKVDRRKVNKKSAEAESQS